MNNNNRRLEDELKDNIINQEANLTISDEHEDDYGTDFDLLSKEADVDLNDPKNIKEFNKKYRLNPQIKNKPELREKNILLSVRHLKQFFKVVKGKYSFWSKAVSNISFDVYEGECLGIVGESGCGKTTTGRSIIKLYEITSGSIYYRGVRISAGNRWNKKEIKWTKIKGNNKIKALKAEAKEAIKALDPSASNYAEKVQEINTNCQTQIAKIKNNIHSVVAEQSAKIRQIKFDNKHVSRKLVNEIQMIFQDPVDSLDPRMTVEDIIQEGLQIQGFKDRAKNHKKVVEMLEKVGLVEEHSARYPHEFSGGQRQRICIARALAVKPDLVICDEPVSALDVSIQAQIINLLKELQNKMGLTYVFISHDLSVVKYITDQILVMYLGNTMEFGDTDDIFDNPLHPYTQALFSAVPVPDPDIKMNRIILSGDIPSPANPPAGCKFHTRCSKCMKVCKYLEPSYIEHAPNHFVSCHLYNQYILDNSKSFDEIYDKVNELKETLKQEQAKAKKEQDKDIIKSIQEEIKNSQGNSSNN